MVLAQNSSSDVRPADFAVVIITSGFSPLLTQVRICILTDTWEFRSFHFKI